MAAPFGPPPVSATTSFDPLGRTRVSVPRLISTTSTLPSFIATGPSGNSSPEVISRISGILMSPCLRKLQDQYFSRSVDFSISQKTSSRCRSDGDNGTPDNLAALQCGVSLIDLFEAVPTGNGLGDTHLPASRQRKQLGQVGADATAIRPHELDATAHQAGDLDPRYRRAGGDANHYHPPSVAGHHEGLHYSL